ncbi:MAG: bifunctional phosphoribosylaminoimidazolecarboxamide formyltransferase/IMP cyclohydrolase [Gammaproteobacteria bacterium]|nr:bifunctional phosphoribosylaminoimidazolecarboxamide formyltransferase/IMP cyclohydrolase [Gammaproteobacteria bacterium]MDE0257412.1 bifunctional phosphoribosylaminoimidazolecarboxamide formyltransferase/IMP cyclohydrolase [Gammaproteobacteria bacterium]
MTRRRALLSVSDKSGIEKFARGLVRRGWEIVSTGGTARALADAGLPVRQVAEVTSHPEMMDGRVKTLHPAIHAGILARSGNRDDTAALAGQGYAPVGLVAVNLYPFRETVARGGVSVGDAMEQVDIGGPTMIRAAAKNHADVWAAVDPADYPRVLAALDREKDSPALRRELAVKVFAHTSGYDDAVAGWLGKAGGSGGGMFPARLALSAELQGTLRYGENPDQEAAFYRWRGHGVAGLAGLEQLHGKALSYNNYLDLDGALQCLAPFAFSARPAVCIVKHTTPAGMALAETLEEAYLRALRTDPVSAFGSVIAVNRRIDGATAAHMSELFIECLVAPAFDDEAMEILARKSGLRLLAMSGDPVAAADLPLDPDRVDWWREAPSEHRASAAFLAAHGRLPEPRTLRTVSGGLLAQSVPSPPFYGLESAEWKVVTRRTPSARELDDLDFAWSAVAGVKSNAILLARDGATLGIGMGQVSRVDASELAVRKAAAAGLDLSGCALASDAFFPFRDGVDAAAAAGVRAIVQPGGSIRDEEVIAAADEHEVAMVFTGRRLFRH